MHGRRFVRALLGIGVSALVVQAGSDRSHALSQVRATGQPPAQAQTVRGPIRAHANAIVVQDGRAYLAVDNLVAIARVVRPGVLTEIGRTPALADRVRDVSVVGTVAYVAAGIAGLRVFDVSVPASPREIAVVPGPAVGVLANSNYAYVARAEQGLEIVDVRNPADPRPVGLLDTDRASDVFVVGPTAYVADDEGGLLVVDVADPARPRTLGWFYTPGDANGVHVVGHLAYLAAGGAGLQIVDVSNPASPAAVGTFDAVYARSVHVVDGRAYVASERDGLWVVDVTNPAAPRSLGSFAGGGSVNAVHVVGGYAYTASALTSARAVAIDISSVARRQ